MTLWLLNKKVLCQKIMIAGYNLKAVGNYVGATKSTTLES